MNTETVTLTTLTRLKNADLYQLCEKLGSMKELSKITKIPYQELGQLVNMQKFPKWFWRKKNKKRIKLEDLCIVHLGKYLNEVIPTSLKDQKLTIPKCIQQTKQVEVEKLLELTHQQPLQLTYEEVLIEQDLKEKRLEFIETCKEEVLNPRKRQVVELYFQGKKLTEIAKIIDVSSSRAGQIFHQSMDLLKKSSKTNKELS